MRRPRITPRSGSLILALTLLGTTLGGDWALEARPVIAQGGDTSIVDVVTSERARSLQRSEQQCSPTAQIWCAGLRAACALPALVGRDINYCYDCAGYA